MNCREAEESAIEQDNIVVRKLESKTSINLYVSLHLPSCSGDNSILPNEPTHTNAVDSVDLATAAAAGATVQFCGLHIDCPNVFYEKS